MKLTEEDKIIIQMREDGHTGQEIADALKWEGQYGMKKVSNRAKKLIEAGLLEKGKTGPRKKTVVEESKIVIIRKNEDVAGHQCQYPKCRLEAGSTFAKVYLCPDHYDKIMLETQVFYQKEDQDEYKKRKNYLRIVHLIPWRYDKKGMEL